MSKTRRHVLYGYAEGDDFNDIACQITERVGQFVSGRDWVSGEAWPVNQRRGDEGDTKCWELGINLELPDPGREASGWFTDVEEIAITCNELARDYARPFVIGISDQETGIADDLFFLDGGAIDIERLRAIIGIGVTE
ncbi:hypothetical protein [Luteolibacter soli]|uniref:DUF4279 domain-containing protein n=1 Tax=Luteolibacter soli TaxID=3135280 RepID=A0ABU9AYB4_9BACT